MFNFKAAFETLGIFGCVAIFIGCWSWTQVEIENHYGEGVAWIIFIGEIFVLAGLIAGFSAGRP